MVPPRPNPPDPILNGDITGGFSNKALVAISISGLIIVFTTLTFLYVYSSRDPSIKQRDRHQQPNNNDAEDYERALEDADVSTLNRAQRRARAKHRMKKNRRLAAHQQPHPANPRPNQDDVGAEQQPAQIAALQPPAVLAEDDIPPPGGIVIERLSRKERQRVAKAEERRERLLYVEERKQQILILEQKRGVGKNTAGNEDKEAAEEMDERKNRLEIEEKEALDREYTEWKFMFPPSIHEEQNNDNYNTGMDGDDGNDSKRETVQQFLTKLYAVRRISLADTAQRYSVSIPTLRRRLTQLEEEGRVHHCGMVDEVRGEYVVVLPEDMTKLANYINEVGCVTLEEVRLQLMGILDLTGNSNVDGCGEDSAVISGNSCGVLAGVK